MRSLALWLPLLVPGSLLAPAAAAAPGPTQAPAGAQDDDELTKAKLAEVLKALKKGLASKEIDARLAALDAAARTVHPDVVTALAGALGDDASQVRDRTLELLGRSPLDEGLEQLQRYYKKNRKALEKDPEQFVLLLKALGRRGDAAAIPTIVDRFWEVREAPVIRARIFALANIREKGSVEALMKLMARADRKHITPWIGDFRLALTILVAVDVGANQDRWRDWWNDNKRSYEIAKKFPPLPEGKLLAWNTFWGLQREYTRPKKRGDRGQDPGR